MNVLQHAKIQHFITESNERIATASKEIERVKSLLPFSEMTMEDIREFYPDQTIRSDKPSSWPHTADFQPENEPERPAHH